MLKNSNNLLPLSPKQHILVTGDGAHNIGKQSGGWTITWQGTNNENSDFPGGSSIFDGIERQVDAAGGRAVLSLDGSFAKKPDVAIVVFGEEPYAEGVGDIANLEYSPNDKKDLALLKSFKEQGIPTIALFITGRPLWVNSELNASDAFVAVWLQAQKVKGLLMLFCVTQKIMCSTILLVNCRSLGPKDPNQIVNVGDADYDPLFLYGFGLTYSDKDTLGDTLSETVETQTQVNDLVFYNRSTQAPWTKTLVSAFNTAPVTASTQSIGSVSYRTQDREVQEDAFSLTTTGGSYAGVRFAGNGTAQDYSQAFSTPKSLSMLVNVAQAPNAPLMLGINCGSVSDCGTVVDITPSLSKLQPNTWQRIKVPAQCWSDLGVDYGKLSEGLSMITAGKMQVSFSDIGFVNIGDDEQTIRCK